MSLGMHGALTPGMRLWYTNNSPFTSYTTVTPHSDSRSDFSAYVTSHIQYTTYKIIACIERTTMLRADIMHVMCEYKAGEGVPCYSRFDKLMSGSSLEGKAILRNHKTLNSKALYFK